MTKITVNWGRLFKNFICGAVLVFLIIYATNLVSGNVSASVENVEYITVIAAKGDTLWSIASENTSGDVNKKVNEIIKFNNKKNSRVELNERIKVPVEK